MGHAKIARRARPCALGYLGDGATSADDFHVGAELRRRVSRRRSCSSARTTSGRSRRRRRVQTAVGDHRHQGARLRHAGRARRRQRRARRLRGHARGGRPRARAATARRSSRPSPTGSARTPRPTIRRATATESRGRRGSGKDPLTRLRPWLAAEKLLDAKAEQPRCARASSSEIRDAIAAEENVGPPALRDADRRRLRPADRGARRSSWPISQRVRGQPRPAPT